ncbi:hypothetical protein [Paracoccus laeviglucosivorans]|uniref:Uncharacterized protein n=1 Tax=Paracoccus laeviglucosivorans TaxID=1197861 RepID=A0A521D2P9_9RHOB|nr:hypothetical protein [Paracoccus laeviglucosivorans]SMO65922.1 hypothetical protein SAMN06265221_10630 [Paracoccus laeviglucosivorans]
MNDPDPHARKPAPPQAGRAAIRIVIVLAVIVIGVFALRQFWHAEERQEDPTSATAPDNTAGQGRAPAE